jgi:hypothetical protein
MRRRARAAGAWAVLAAAVALAAPATAPAAEVAYELGFASAYVWRGIALTDGPVFQPAVRISHASGVSLDLWGNVDLDDDNDLAGEIGEARITIDCGRRFGAFELGGGLTEYLFPNTPYPGTREVYFRGAFHAAVTPKLELFYDFDEIQGLYARLSFAWEHPLGAHWRSTLEASAAYAESGFSVSGEGGPHDAGLELRLERRIRKLDLRLTGAWTDSLDENVLPEQPVGFWAGAMVALGV